MIGIALDVDHLRRDIFRPVANRVDKDAATHRAIGTSRARLIRTCNLEFFQLRDSGRQIESQE